MSLTERDRLAMFRQLETGRITLVEAAAGLSLSDRQAKRLWKRYREVGEPGQTHIAPRCERTTNPRTQRNRIARRAGMKFWPKPWQNMRARRETELMRDDDLATVCKWIGNSPSVAARYDAMSADLDADFARAAGLKAPTGPEARQKAQQS